MASYAIGSSGATLSVMLRVRLVMASYIIHDNNENNLTSTDDSNSFLLSCKILYVQPSTTRLVEKKTKGVVEPKENNTLQPT